jgi:putative addiction module component (TIGR02574 family)
MGHDAELLLRSALALPQAERSEIAGRLLESLEPPPETSVEEAWRVEVAARVAALDAGEVETVPWEEVRNRLLEKLSERRGESGKEDRHE